MGRKKSAYKLPKLKLKPKTVIAVGTLVSFILAILSLASIITPSEQLAFWREALFQNFGWTFIFSPVIFVLVGLVLQKVKWTFAQFNVLIGLITSLVAIMGLTGIASSRAAGDLGTFLWTELSPLLTPLGAGALLLIVFLIGIVVMLNASLDQIMGVFGSAGGAMKKGATSLKKEKGFETPAAPVRLNNIEDAALGPRIAPKPAANLPAPAAAKKEKDDVASDTVIQNVAGQTLVWKYPPLNILSDKGGAPADRGDVKKSAARIEQTLESFGIQARVAEVNGGPAITQYALEIAAGTKITKIANLQNDIALALATRTGTVRIEAPIPGKSLVGIEVPNHSLEVVTLKSIMASEEMKKNRSKLAVALGKDTSSKPVVVDVAKMPHCLIAGTTGSGKSVMMHNFISSLVFRNSPDELKLILIDPKRVEMSNYNGIPHLLAPVIVEPEKALSSLKWAMAEMDRRYKLFQSVGVRNIAGYNEMSGFQALPYIVIFIDELADLMMFAPVEIEEAITRIAQLARAVGIHLVVATQRPSVDVITGLMKANIPCRIAFNVASLVDSRVIIDSPGAEKLLGRGDMLYMPPDASKPVRVQGVFLSDGEINGLVSFIKNQGIEPQYSSEVTEQQVSVGKGRGAMMSGDGGDQDDLFEEAVRTVCQYDRASASLLQRRLRIGYARAARIIDELEAAGVIGPGDGAKPRDVLVRNADEFFSAQGGEAA